MDISLYSFWIAFGVAAVFAYPIYQTLLRLKSRQIIDQYAPATHQVKQGTPTMGGLIVVAGFIAAASYCLGAFKDPEARSFVLAGLVLFLGFATIGFVDDFVVPRLIKGKRGLGWKQKIILEFLITYAGVGLAVGFTHIIPILVYGFIVLFFANAFNFADGLDGLSGSILIALVLGFVGITSGQVGAPLGADAMLFALLAAVIPFLYLNAPPAKMFMGDVGSLPIGAVLGLVASYLVMPVSGAVAVLDAGMILPLFVLSFMMIAELVPVPMQVAYYKVTKGKRLFPMTPIHHAFEKKGWPETRIVWAFALTQGLLSALAYTLVAIR